MSESMRIWMEITFNIAYLIVVWIMVILMLRRQPTVPESDKPVTKLFIWAFALLALGDTGHDRPFTWIGIMILLSYAFYIPVILFVQDVPVIGMLMIPKTMAYVGIALIAYYSLFKQKEEAESSVPAVAG